MCRRPVEARADIHDAPSGLIGQRHVLFDMVVDYCEFGDWSDLIMSGLIPSRASFVRRFLRWDLAAHALRRA